MQATESDVGPVRRYLLERGHHRALVVLCHGVLNHNRLRLCRHAFCHFMESPDEEEAEVHNRRYVEPWLLVRYPY
jgi:nitrate reductase cytochrome c-type subunit